MAHRHDFDRRRRVWLLYAHTLQNDCNHHATRTVAHFLQFDETGVSLRSKQNNVMQNSRI